MVLLFLLSVCCCCFLLFHFARLRQEHVETWHFLWYFMAMSPKLSVACLPTCTSISCYKFTTIVPKCALNIFFVAGFFLPNFNGKCVIFSWVEPICIFSAIVIGIFEFLSMIRTSYADFSHFISTYQFTSMSHVNELGKIVGFDQI